MRNCTVPPNPQPVGTPKNVFSIRVPSPGWKPLGVHTTALLSHYMEAALGRAWPPLEQLSAIEGLTAMKCQMAIVSASAQNVLSGRDVFVTNIAHPLSPKIHPFLYILKAASGETQCASLLREASKEERSLRNCYPHYFSVQRLQLHSVLLPSQLILDSLMQLPSLLTS